jgi:protein subunit release factor B
MERQLLFRLTKKDFIVQPFRGSGNGGQNRNKVSSCCRISHPASGAVAEGKEQRDFPQNKKAAFKRLVEKPEFQKWHKIECSKALGRYIDAEKWVDEQMDVNNLKFEIRVDGKWTKVELEDIKDLDYDELDD